MMATLAWSKIGFATTRPSPTCAGATAAAGARASAAAASNAQVGMLQATGGLSRFCKAAAAAMIATIPTPATPTAENPNRRKSGKVTALCTAHPRAGEVGKASAGGRMRRPIEKPSKVQNSNATTAPMAALSVDAMRSSVRFRSSPVLAASSDANFGIKGTLATIWFKCGFEFEVPTRTCGNNDRKFKFTALVSQVLSARVQCCERAI